MTTVRTEEVERMLAQLRKAAPDASRRALARCGLIAVGAAKANAPRSPTMKQHSATLKRKKRTTRRMLPGGLEKSIQYDLVDAMTASVFVASNSMAGKYAKRIHDEKGVSWRNRGPGTVAKGPRADDKFILRAIWDNQAKFQKVFEDEIRKALPK